MQFLLSTRIFKVNLYYFVKFKNIISSFSTRVFKVILYFY